MQKHSGEQSLDYIFWWHCSVDSFEFFFYQLGSQPRNNLNSIVKIFSKIIRVKQRDLGSFCNQQIPQKAAHILPLCEYFLYEGCLLKLTDILKHLLYFNGIILFSFKSGQQINTYGIFKKLILLGLNSCLHLYFFHMLTSVYFLCAASN